jgi:hypothetical protein
VILTNADAKGISVGSAEWVMPDLEPGDNLNVVKLNRVDPYHDWRHDSEELAQEIITMVREND